MERPFEIGLGFGLTSGVLTTLGLIVGLSSSTQSKTAVIGGILTIAMADAFSDALGIHISQETQGQRTHREIWKATLITFLTKLIFATTFIVPVLLLDLPTAVWVSLGWGFLLLAGFSFAVARRRHEPPWKRVGEHLLFGILVVVTTNLIGRWVAARF